MLWSTSGIPALKVVYDYTSDELLVKKKKKNIYILCALIILARFNGEEPSYNKREERVPPRSTQSSCHQQHTFDISNNNSNTSVAISILVGLAMTTIIRELDPLRLVFYTEWAKIKLNLVVYHNKEIQSGRKEV